MEFLKIHVGKNIMKKNVTHGFCDGSYRLSAGIISQSLTTVFLMILLLYGMYSCWCCNFDRNKRIKIKIENCCCLFPMFLLMVLTCINFGLIINIM